MRTRIRSTIVQLFSLGLVCCGPQRVELYDIEQPEPEGRWSVTEAQRLFPLTILNGTSLLYGRAVERGGRSGHYEPSVMELESGRAQPVSLPTFEGLVRRDTAPITDGQRVLLAAKDHSVEDADEGAFYFWDGTSFEEVIHTRCFSRPPQFEFAPNGRLAFTVYASSSGCDGAKTLVAYDPATKVLRTLSSKESKLYGMAQAGELIIFLEGDQLSVHFWSDNETHRITNTALSSSAGERPGGVAYAQDGHIAFIEVVGEQFREPNTIKLWEPATRAVRTMTENAHLVLAFSGDSRFLTYTRIGPRAPQDPGPTHTLRLIGLFDGADQELSDDVHDDAFVVDPERTRLVYFTKGEQVLAWSFAQGRTVALEGCAEATKTFVYAEHTAMLCDAEGLVVHDRSGAVQLWVEDASRMWSVSAQGPLLFSSQDSLQALFLGSLTRRTLAVGTFNHLTLAPSHVAFVPEDRRIDVVRLEE